MSVADTAPERGPVFVPSPKKIVHDVAFSYVPEKVTIPPAPMFALKFVTIGGGAVGLGVGFAVGFGVGVGAGVGTGVRRGVGTGVGRGVGAGVNDGDGLGLSEGEGLGLADGDGLGLGLGLGLGVASGTNVTSPIAGAVAVAGETPPAKIEICGWRMATATMTIPPVTSRAPRLSRMKRGR